MKMKYFKIIIWSLSIICPLLFIASLYFLRVGMFGIAFNGFVAFGTILLALSTFYILFESKRQLYDQYRKEHLDEIRNTCLRPILSRINDNDYNYLSFEIKENQVRDEVSLQRELDSPTHSYDREVIFGYNYEKIVNNNLYKDLQNHKITKGIPDDFKDILNLIIKNYPEYLKNLIKLIERIKSLDKFKEFENRLKLNPNYEYIKNNYFRLIVVITLDYPNVKRDFPNDYNLAYNNKELENIEKIGAIFKDSNEVNLIKTAKDEVKEKVEKLKEKIEGILDDKSLMLDDECDYLKKMHAQIYQ